MSQVMFKSVSPKRVIFLFTHYAYINIPVLYILQNIATMDFHFNFNEFSSSDLEN